MSDIKSISHQGVHSTQSEPPEGSNKASQVAKKTGTVEATALTKTQKEIIKQSKSVENKMGEIAIKARAEKLLNPSESSRPAEFLAASQEGLDTIKESLFGDEKPIKAEKSVASEMARVAREAKHAAGIHIRERKKLPYSIG